MFKFACIHTIPLKESFFNIVLIVIIKISRIATLKAEEAILEVGHLTDIVRVVDTRQCR